MTTPTVRLHRWDEIALEKVTEMISRKIVTGDREMLAQIYLKKGALVPMHSHESEQMTYVLQGAMKFLVGGEEITLGRVKSCTSRRGSNIRPRRSTTRSSWMFSAPSARTGSITPIRTFTSSARDSRAGDGAQEPSPRRTPSAPRRITKGLCALGDLRGEGLLDASSVIAWQLVDSALRIGSTAGVDVELAP